MGLFDPRREVHDPLQAEPERLHAGLAIALATEKPAQASNQANDVVDGRGPLLGSGVLVRM